MAASSSTFKVGFAAILLHGLAASAAVQLGDTAELFVTATAGARYDDNILQTSDNTLDDVILQFSPGIELKAGREGGNSARLSYVHDFLFYTSEDQYNASLANIQAQGEIQTARSSFTARGYFTQLEGNTQDFLGSRSGDLVRRDRWGGNVNSETEITGKSSVAIGLAINETDYAADIFSDQFTTNVPVNFYYKATPKLDLSTGYEWRNTSLGEIVIPTSPTTTTTFKPAGNSSHFFNVGTRGQLTPKLSSNLRVGAELRDDRAADDTEWTFAVDGTLTWAASPKSSYSLELGRRFDTAGSGDAYTRSNVALIATYALSEQLSVQGEARYERSEYEAADRDDDYLEFSVGAGYLLSEKLSLNAGYIFRTNSSTNSLLEFDNNVLSVSATFRY